MHPDEELAGERQVARERKLLWDAIKEMQAQADGLKQRLKPVLLEPCTAEKATVDGCDGKQPEDLCELAEGLRQASRSIRAIAEGLGWTLELLQL
jgi:hypothetical protein